MKTENTSESKVRFFALYYHQLVWRRLHSNGEKALLYINGNTLSAKQGNMNGDYLELTPLSQISDEDAIEVAKMVLEPADIEALSQYLVTIGKNIIEYIYDGEVNRMNYVIVSLPITYHLIPRQILMIDRFLVSRGYYVGDGTEVEYGWVVLKTT